MIEKVVFYTVKCDECAVPLEDYTGELARITETKEDAKRIAIKNGFCYNNKKWYCPVCAKKLCLSNKLNIDMQEDFEKFFGEQKVVVSELVKSFCDCYEKADKNQEIRD